MTGAVAVQEGRVHLKKEKEREELSAEAHTQRSRRDSGTYAAQADPLLRALRHVLPRIVLRPVMSDVRADSKRDKWALHPPGAQSVATFSLGQNASMGLLKGNLLSLF